MYALKVWITTVIVASIPLGILVSRLGDGVRSTFRAYSHNSDISGSIILVLIFGLIASLPSFIIFGLSVYWVKSMAIATIYKKMLLSVIAVLVITLPFIIIIDPEEMLEAITIAIVGWLSAIASAAVFFFKL